MKRFSVLYLLKEQYHHIGTNTQAEARAILEKLLTDKRRTPVGIYDDKTELIEWEPTRQRAYDRTSIGEQGNSGNQIIAIAQALRRRDSSWRPSGDFKMPSLFA